MDARFQVILLRYIVQSSDSPKFLKYIKSSHFDLVIHQIIFDVLSQYHDQYGRLPSKDVAQQYAKKELAKLKGVQDDIIDMIQDMLMEIYDTPLEDGDEEYIKTYFIEKVQEKETDVAITDYASGGLSLLQLIGKLTKVETLSKQAEIFDTKGFLLQDIDYHTIARIPSAPTFLHDLNMLTSAGGFYSPQLIIFMSGPKHFKTGLLIKLAVEYARDGYNVYYADNENGLKAVRDRGKMAIMECTLDELYNYNNRDELKQLVHNFHLYMGGDMFIDYFPAGTTTITDIRGRLQQIYEDRNWIPDIIFWDSIDHFLPSNPKDQAKDGRIQIQKVYHEVIALNNDLKCFSIAPSQVNRKAVDKKIFDIKDIAEDFGKMMNAHAIFSINGTPEEKELGIRRIIPVLQREGLQYKGYNQCIVQIDEEKMIINEVNKEKYLGEVDDD